MKKQHTKTDPLTTTAQAEALARRMAYGLPSLFKPTRAVERLAKRLMKFHQPTAA